MRPCRRLFPLALAFALVLPMSLATSEIGWTHKQTDGTDDVINVLTNTTVADMDGLDIVSAGTREDGTYLSVEMELAGEVDPEAIYTLEVEVDEDEERTYSFSYMDGRFSVGGPGLSGYEPDGHVSDDGRHLLWEIVQERLHASSLVEVSCAETFRLVGMTPFTDTLPDGGGGSGGGVTGGDRVHMLVRVEVASVTHVRTTVEVVVDREDAPSVRTEFDTDGDRTVSKAEYDQHIGFHHLTLSSWNTTDLTLDGLSPERRVMGVAFEGVIGRTDSSSPVSQVVTLDIYFPRTAEGDSHVYSGDLWGGGHAGEPWQATSDSQYVLVIPKGWTLDGSWTGAHSDHLDIEGRRFTMDGAHMGTDWNATMGQTSSVTIVKDDGMGSGDEGSPGFGHLLAGIAIIGAMAVASVSRRG